MAMTPDQVTANLKVLDLFDQFTVKFKIPNFFLNSMKFLVVIWTTASVELKYFT